MAAHKPANPIKQQRKMDLAVWSIPIIAALLAAVAVWQSVPLSALLWPSAIIAALLFLTAAQAKRHTRLRDVSGLLLAAALTTTLAALLAQNGFSLIAAELALLLSLISLPVGWAFNSTPSVTLSVFAGLVYLASFFPELGLTTGLVDQTSNLGAAILPWLILGQIILAQKVESSLALLAGIFAGYVWLGTAAGDMPLSAMAGLMFAIAAAQFCLGRAWLETRTFGANIHRFAAWTVMMSAAVYIQFLWLTAFGQAEPFWPPSSFWIAGIAIAMLTLIIAALMRFKTSDLSLPGIFIVCLAVSTLPIATARPDLVFAVFDAVPGLNARPGFGLVIGAAIIAAGLFWLVGGLRRGSFLNISMGAVTIGVQAIFLLQPDRFNADLGVVFIVSLICALCIGGLIAGASPDQRSPLTSYA